MLRKLGEADAFAYRDVRLFALRESPTAFGASYEQESAMMGDAFIAHYRARVVEPAGFVIGAFEVDGSLVGTAGLFFNAGLKSQHKALLWGIFVRPSARHQGLASRLVAAVILAARAIPGLEQINLSVVSTNENAIRLYLAAGFKCYGCEPRALRVDGIAHDENLMSLDLRPTQVRNF